MNPPGDSLATMQDNVLHGFVIESGDAKVIQALRLFEEGIEKLHFQETGLLQPWAHLTTENRIQLFVERADVIRSSAEVVQYVRAGQGGCMNCRHRQN